MSKKKPLSVIGRRSAPHVDTGRIVKREWAEKHPGKVEWVKGRGTSSLSWHTQGTGEDENQRHSPAAGDRVGES